MRLKPRMRTKPKQSRKRKMRLEPRLKVNPSQRMMAKKRNKHG
jgi:hypothetical protein